MAASAVRASAGSRTGSAKWGRPRPLPVAHPMASRSMDIDLTLVGTTTPGLMNAASPRILEWPPLSEKVEKTHRGRRPVVSKSTVWRSNDDLVDMVKDKLTQGLDGVHEMFKAKDPYGGSIVSPEGLFQIVRSLVGHISREQFDSFMKAICLHWRSSISFDEFIVRFADNPAVAQYSTAEAIRKGKQPDNIEENLRSTTMLEWCPFTSAPHAFVVFRRRLQKGEINIRDIFPPACFLKDGRIIQPQLRDALAKMDIRLTDKEFYNLWQKFDPDYNGSIPVKRFYKTLDLKQNGLPKTQHVPPRSAQSVRSSSGMKQKKLMEKRCKTEMHTSSSKRENISVSKVNSFEILGDKAEIVCHEDQQDFRPIVTSHSQEKITTTTTEVQNTTEEVETTTTTKRTTTTTETVKREEKDNLVDDARLSAHVQALISQKKSAPTFDSTMDMLHYKFEESYRSLLAAFQLFDFMNDGYVTRIDFRRVLKEFGFEVNAIDLDAFLQRAGIAVIQGLVNYQQFLQRFYSKSDSSIANRVVIRDHENSTLRKKHIKTEETLRMDNMETSVSNFFQNDYNKLLNMLKDKDTKKTGSIPAHELRRVINSVLKTNVSDQQFQEIVVRLTDKSNHKESPSINYNNFLDLFCAEPGSWNRKQDGPYVSHKYQLGDIPPPPPVLRLQEKAKTWMAIPLVKDHPTDTRIGEIKRDLTKLFTDRFHIFDKTFKEMDRRRTGYMSKWQFGACLKLCGITLSIPDLDYVWSTLDTAADNTLGYASLVKTFCGGNKVKLEQAGGTASRPASKASTKRDTPDKPEKVKVMIIQQPSVTTGSAKERKLTSLLRKVKEDVMSRWDVLHSVFLSLDKHGYSTISVQDMREIVHKLKFSLNERERNELINFYDLQANGWFSYMSFMQAVKAMQPARNVNPYVFDVHTKRLHNKASPTSRALTLHDVLVELKEMLLKKHKTLRGAFKTFDLNGNGYIEEGELRQSLTSLGYHLCPQDFHDICEVFDRSQGKRISFQEFKDTLLAL